MKEASVDAWEQEKEDIRKKQDVKKAQITEVQEAIWKQTQEMQQLQEERLHAEEALLVQKQKMEQSKWDDVYEQEFQEYLAGRRSENYEYLQKQKIASRYPKMDEREEAYQKLVEERSTYLRSYANRTFSATNRDNEAYDRLLDELQCEELETFKDAAKDQARAAVEHFKDRFADQPWLIYDVKRQYGYYYDLKEMKEVTFENPQQAHLVTGMLNESLMANDEKLFRQLWKTYFKAICIKERWNPRKHRQDMPVRYWKYLTEKQ